MFRIFGAWSGHSGHLIVGIFNQGVFHAYLENEKA